MNKGRTPIPKTQREISISQQEPYNPPAGSPGFEATGNPNGSGELNRAEKTSFRGDTVKPFTVGIQDIDEAIMYYFKNVIKPYVVQNGERIEVPVIYGSPEKWKSFQADGYYRDLNGKIMAPLLVFRRTNIEKVKNIGNKLDANKPNNFGIFEKKYNKQNEYSKFNILNNVKPEKQYYATVIPDYVNITYECVIFTYYNDQLNKIMEAVQYASDSYWGDPARYKFKSSIDSFSTVSELVSDNERTVRSTFSIKLNGYIIPDVVQKDMTAIKKFSDKTTLTFTLETVSGDIDSFNANVQQTVTQGGGLASIIDSPNVSNITNNVTNNVINITSSNVDINTLIYLNTSKAIQAASITEPDIAIFSGSFLTAPTGLPATSTTSFSYYVNGQLVEPNAVIYFIDNADGTCTLDLDNTELGFTLQSSDEVVAIGKFA
jgi:hypothetical protein